MAAKPVLRPDRTRCDDRFGVTAITTGTRGEVDNDTLLPTHCVGNSVRIGFSPMLPAHDCAAKGWPARAGSWT
jgi:hypothetical protein